MIEGVLHIQSETPLRDLRGVVRLEDVTELDTNSQVRAQTTIAPTVIGTPLPFRIQVSELLDAKRRYAVSAELTGFDSEGQEHRLGSIEAYPWPDGTGEAPVSISVTLWN